MSMVLPGGWIKPKFYKSVDPLVNRGVQYPLRWQN